MAAEKQGGSCTSGAEGKPPVCSSSEGKTSDKHEVNFALNSFVPCGLAATAFVALFKGETKSNDMF